MDERRTSPVELLWDLVFVFAVTQVTTLLSRDLSWPGFGHGMLVLALVWWAWSAYVWAANAEQEESRVLRGVLLLAMVLIFIAGLSLPHAFGDRATLFACSYAGVRLLHLALYAYASRRGSASWSAIAGFATTVVIGMALLVAGSFLDETAAGLALDAGGGDRLRGPGLAHARAPARTAAGGGRSFRRALRPVRDHLPGRVDRRDRPERERASRWTQTWSPPWPSACSRRSGCGGRTSTASPSTAEARLREHDDPVLAAADGYSYLHLVIVAGIIIFAVGMKSRSTSSASRSPTRRASRSAADSPCTCSGTWRSGCGWSARSATRSSRVPPALLAVFALGGGLSALWVTALATLVLAALCALETLEPA